MLPSTEKPWKLTQTNRLVAVWQILAETRLHPNTSLKKKKGLWKTLFHWSFLLHRDGEPPTDEYCKVQKCAHSKIRTCSPLAERTRGCECCPTTKQQVKAISVLLLCRGENKLLCFPKPLVLHHQFTSGKSRISVLNWSVICLSVTLKLLYFFMFLLLLTSLIFFPGII